jgi:acetyltransferase-like isoleucine patch superfamily enzyme
MGSFFPGNDGILFGNFVKQGRNQMGKGTRLGRMIFERPYHLWKYAIQTIRVLLNTIFLGMQRLAQPNFKIGSNPRVLSFNAFKAEMPDAQIKIGDSLIVYNHCDILVTGKGRLTIGNGCIIGSDFRLYCKDRIELGDHVLISWNVFIGDYDGHPINPEERLIQMQYMHRAFFPSQNRGRGSDEIGNYSPSYETGPVVIGDNVWIGANVSILKGVHIGSGSVVAAGAVVTKDIPARCIAAGNPARVVREL